jgi:NAD(P)-dependent dehydrogenase (short-subunit alcohol dehydrogenase family)
MMSSASKVALITGGGTGIGKSAALALAKNGYSIVITGRRKEPLEKTVAEVEKLGVRALGLSADVGKPGDVDALFTKVRETFGRLDVLFNNAGMGAPAVPLEDLPFEKWQQVVDVNFTGVFLCTQAAFRIMKDQNPRGGRIINNGSISAHAPRPNSAPYTSTKHAVTGLTKAASLDGRKYDIAVGQIDIGNAETELAARMANGVAQADGSIKPEPLMNVDHVGQAVAYMAGLPLESNVLFMTVMATKMPFVGRG